MGLSKKDRYVYCYECGSRGEMNGVCKICGHRDVPLLAGMVPNLIGKTRPEAGALLAGPEAQLALESVTEENSETVAEGLVISSNPIADTQLVIGDSVNIVVSLGPAT